MLLTKQRKISLQMRTNEGFDTVDGSIVPTLDCHGCKDTVRVGHIIIIYQLDYSELAKYDSSNTPTALVRYY